MLTAKLSGFEDVFELFIHDILIKETCKVHKNVVAHCVSLLDPDNKIRSVAALKILDHRVNFRLVFTFGSEGSPYRCSRLILVPYSYEIFIVCLIEFIDGL